MCIRDRFHRVPHQSWIVDDRPSRVASQGLLGQQTHQVVALDELTAFVEEEAAVEVAVPGKAQVCLVLEHRMRRGGAILREEGVPVSYTHLRAHETVLD